MSKKCQKCGAEMADNMNFCPQCHQKVESAPAAPAPAQQPAAAPAPAAGTPAQSKGKKVWSAIGSIVGFLILVGVIAFNQFQPKLLNKAREESLTNILVKDGGYRAGSVEVHHISDLRYGVWVSSSPGLPARLEAEDPAFCMVLNEKTNKWEPASDEDRKMLIIYKRVSHGDIDALKETF
ncbi:MAG: zinc ribbon domain-containing protein [Lentisphaeria bacterium]|nr:zinc ribbon domain-containing protein [Lentisphaeria bacterium]